MALCFISLKYKILQACLFLHLTELAFAICFQYILYKSRDPYTISISNKLHSWALRIEFFCILTETLIDKKGSVDLMDKVSASQPRNRGFEPHTGHDHESSYDTSTGWFQEADSRVINISC